MNSTSLTRAVAHQGHEATVRGAVWFWGNVQMLSKRTGKADWQSGLGCISKTVV
ncbi:MAG: hypothetical protein AAFV90_00330 [Cyanobacteria bacterium J06634_5]